MAHFRSHNVDPLHVQPAAFQEQFIQTLCLFQKYPVVKLVTAVLDGPFDFKQDRVVLITAVHDNAVLDIIYHHNSAFRRLFRQACLF